MQDFYLICSYPETTQEEKKSSYLGITSTFLIFYCYSSYPGTTLDFQMNLVLPGVSQDILKFVLNSPQDIFVFFLN